MSEVWMVRAGEQGYLFDDFETKNLVAIGWSNIHDLTGATTAQQIRGLYDVAYPNEKPGKVANAVSMLHRFRSVIALQDRVITYNPGTRKYLVGTIISDYIYRTDLIEGFAHIRKMRWDASVSRDLLSVATRNSLGSVLTLFAVSPESWNDIQRVMNGKPQEQIVAAETPENLELIREDTTERAFELIKDKILSLDDHQMEHLVAAVLRAMGYRTRVSPKGADRGVDVSASPDGLGLTEPRIKAEVKHRPTTPIGSSDVRSFLGGLRAGDKGLYFSTGGYTREAKYEAERATVPLTLLDLNDLAELVLAHYENFDLEGRALVPLVKVYYPAE